MGSSTVSLGKRIAKDSSLVTLISIGVQALTFLSSIYVAAIFGADWRTDAYFFALTIPWIFINVVSVVVKSVLVPVFIEYKVNCREQIGDIIGSTIVTVSIFSLIGMIALFIFMPEFIPRMGLKFTEEGLDMVILITRELIFVIPLASLAGVIGAVYNSYQRFSIPATLRTSNSLLLIASVFIFSDILGIQSLVLGTVIGSLVELILLLILMKRSGLEVNLSFRLHPALVRMGKLALFPIMGGTLLQLNPLVDRTFASHLSQGSITALNYAEKINVIPGMILGTGFLSVLLSHWSQVKSEGDLESVKKSLISVLSSVIVILSPIVALLFVLRHPIIQIVYERGAFDPIDTMNTAYAIGLLVWAIIPSYLSMVMIRIFLVLQDTATPFFVGVANVIINYSLDAILVPLLGLGGVALSTSLTQLILTISLFILVASKIGPILWSELLIRFAKILVAVIFCGLTTWIVFRVGGEIFRIEGLVIILISAISGGAGILLFLLVGKALQINELLALWSAVKNRSAINMVIK